MDWNPTEQRCERRERGIFVGKAKVSLHNIGVQISKIPAGSRRLPGLRRRACKLMEVVGRDEGRRQLSFSI